MLQTIDQLRIRNFQEDYAVTADARVTQSLYLNEDGTVQASIDTDEKQVVEQYTVYTKGGEEIGSFSSPDAPAAVLLTLARHFDSVEQDERVFEEYIRLLDAGNAVFAINTKGTDL